MPVTTHALAQSGKAYSISRLTEHDLLEVVQIEETSGLSRWGWAAYYAELQGQFGSLMLVARLDGNELANPTHQLAGYIVARVTAGELHINNFAVRERYRGQGIGRALLTSILLTPPVGGRRVLSLSYGPVTPLRAHFMRSAVSRLRPGASDIIPTHPRMPW